VKNAVLSLAVVRVGNTVMIEPLHADDRPAVRVLAAGSLRAAIGEIAGAFSAATGIAIESGFGPSGLLRERIEKEEGTDLFASADMGNPLALSRAGKAGRSCSSRAIGFAPRAAEPDGHVRDASRGDARSAPQARHFNAQG